MAFARSQSFDNLITITSVNNAEFLKSEVWKPRTATGGSVDSLESGYDTVDGRRPGERVKVKIENGNIFPKKKKKDARTICKQLFEKDFSIKVLVIILFFMIVISIPLIWHFYNAKELEVELGRKIKFYEKERLLKVNRDGLALLSGSLGENLPDSHLPHNCGKGNKTEICLRWFNEALLRIHYVEYDDILCYNVEWNAEQEDSELMDCFDFAGSNWYGGPLLNDQKWPLDFQSYPSTPYISGSLANEDLFGSVIERHWVSSKGVGLSVDTHNPLFISSNSTLQRLCLRSHYFNSPYRNELNLKPALNYTLCTAPNSTTMTQFFITNHTPLTKSLPDIELMKYPTFAHPRQTANETEVLTLIDSVNGSNSTQLPGKVLELDIYTNWEAHSGDFDLDPFSFPGNFTKKLLQKGFQLSLGVHPFADVSSKAFHEGVKKNYFVRDSSGDVPGLTKWWNGLGAVLDTINDEAVNWYINRLQKVQQDLNIKRFIFYGGEASWLPHHPTFSKKFSNPDHYARAFVAMVSKFGNQSQLQVSTQTQDVPVFIRLEDRMSSWESLQQIIPTVLTLSVHGYSFINPGTIGGAFTPGNFPEKDLYQRWAQLATFLPIMQFPLSDNLKNVNTEYLTQLHINYVYPKLTKAAHNTLVTGDPIFRPMWWIDPYEFRMLKVDSQFLIGDDLLVAPVLERGAKERDIVLPFGVWTHVDSRVQYSGPKTLSKFQVPLDKIAYFERLKV